MRLPVRTDGIEYIVRGEANLKFESAGTETTLVSVEVFWRNINLDLAPEYKDLF